MRIFLLLALLAPLPAQAEDLPDVAKLADHLDAGVRSWLAGKPLASALVPWQGSVRGDEAQLVAALKAAGVVRLELVATEVEFNLEGASGHVGVRTVVSAVQGDVQLLEVRAYSESSPSGVALGLATPAQTPLAKAAQAMGNRLLQADCATMAVLDPAARWPDAPFLEQARGGAERTKERLPEACALVLAEPRVVTHFRADDVAFLARGAQGEYLGLLDSELELDGGAVILELGRFEPLEPQDEAPQEAAPPE